MRIGSVVAGGVVVMALAGAVYWTLRADPLPADLAPVTTGPMQVTVTAEDMTRVRDTWSVTAPITGTVERLPVQVGDRVTKHKSKVARIRPAASALLDARLRQQVEAGVAEAQAAVRLAEVTLAQAQEQTAYADRGGEGLSARIEPRGFTRVSALGIDEQRVHVFLDIESPPKMRAALGDRYRVFVNVVLWSAPAVLQVPQSALFRQGDGWALLRAAAFKAVVTPVQIGHSQDQLAEVMGAGRHGRPVSRTSAPATGSRSRNGQ